MLISRRALAGMAAGAMFGQGQRRPRIGAVVTSYYWYSHADVVLGRLMAGCSPNGKWHANRCEVVSLFTHQVHERDMSRELSARNGFKIYDTIEGALTLGGKDLAVDAVVFIGEHGNYPENEFGQKMYPRYELFSEILDVYEKRGRTLPTFFDKHLSYSWDKAQKLYARAKKLNLQWMAGSSVPLSMRVPFYVPPFGARMDEAVMIGYGGWDAYGFHTLECLQATVERRAGGETGVKAVQMVTGAAVWEYMEGSAGAWSKPLVQAAVAACPGAKTGSLQNLVKKPALFLLEYNDGLRAACYMLDGVVADWAFAGKVDGKTQAFKFGPTDERRTLPHFDGLAHCIEEMFLTGKPQYPVERTLLTTGALAIAFESQKGGKRVETPSLAIRYAGPRNPFIQTA